MTDSTQQPRPGAGKGTLEVLVVEEDPAQCQLVKACLAAPGRENIHLEFVHSIEDALKAIRGRKYNCVLVSHQLPDGPGLDLLEEAHDQLLTTPVIGLSSEEDTAIAVEYFRAGCVDVFVKSEVLNADKLRRGIARAMARFHQRAMSTVIERRQLGNAVIKSQEGLIALARTARLMGICNRAVFDDYFATHHAEAIGRQGQYALCMIDVDHFKLYNDHYGHAPGDDVLRQVARTLNSTLRANDFIARYGGEEIAVLLDEVDFDSAGHVADRLRRLVYERNIPHEGSENHGRVTVSIGVAFVGPECSETAEEVLIRADDALYRAKAEGRNRVVVADAMPRPERMSA